MAEASSSSSVNKFYKFFRGRSGSRSKSQPQEPSQIQPKPRISQPQKIILRPSSVEIAPVSTIPPFVHSQSLNHAHSYERGHARYASVDASTGTSAARSASPTTPATHASPSSFTRYDTLSRPTSSSTSRPVSSTTTGTHSTIGPLPFEYGHGAGGSSGVSGRSGWSGRHDRNGSGNGSNGGSWSGSLTSNRRTRWRGSVDAVAANGSATASSSSVVSASAQGSSTSPYGSGSAIASASAEASASGSQVSHEHAFTHDSNWSHGSESQNSHADGQGYARVDGGASTYGASLHRRQSGHELDHEHHASSQAVHTGKHRTLFGISIPGTGSRSGSRRTSFSSSRPGTPRIFTPDSTGATGINASLPPLPTALETTNDYKSDEKDKDSGIAVSFLDMTRTQTHNAPNIRQNQAQALPKSFPVGAGISVKDKSPSRSLSLSETSSANPSAHPLVHAGNDTKSDATRQARRRSGKSWRPPLFRTRSSSSTRQPHADDSKISPFPANPKPLPLPSLSSTDLSSLSLPPDVPPTSSSARANSSPTSRTVPLSRSPRSPRPLPIIMDSLDSLDKALLGSLEFLASEGVENSLSSPSPLPLSSEPSRSSPLPAVPQIIHTPPTPQRALPISAPTPRRPGGLSEEYGNDKSDAKRVDGEEGRRLDPATSFVDLTVGRPDSRLDISIRVEGRGGAENKENQGPQIEPGNNSKGKGKPLKSLISAMPFRPSSPLARSDPISQWHPDSDPPSNSRAASRSPSPARWKSKWKSQSKSMSRSSSPEHSRSRSPVRSSLDSGRVVTGPMPLSARSHSPLARPHSPLYSSPLVRSHSPQLSHKTSAYSNTDGRLHSTLNASQQQIQTQVQVGPPKNIMPARARNRARHSSFDFEQTRPRSAGTGASAGPYTAHLSSGRDSETGLIGSWLNRSGSTVRSGSRTGGVGLEKNVSSTSKPPLWRSGSSSRTTGDTVQPNIQGDHLLSGQRMAGGGDSINSKSSHTKSITTNRSGRSGKSNKSAPSALTSPPSFGGSPPLPSPSHVSSPLSSPSLLSPPMPSSKASMSRQDSPSGLQTEAISNHQNPGGHEQGRISSLGRSTGRRIYNRFSLGLTHGPFSFEPPVAVPTTPLQRGHDDNRGARPQSGSFSNTRSRSPRRFHRWKPSAVSEVDDMPENHVRNDQEDSISAPSSPHISNYGRSKAKGRSLDLGLGLSWAPTKLKEEAIMPAFASSNARGTGWGGIGRNGNILHNVIGTDTATGRAIRTSGSDMSDVFKDVLGEAAFAKFKKYVRHFDAHSIPLEGPSGLLARVEKLLNAAHAPGLGPKEKKEILDSFGRFVLANS